MAENTLNQAHAQWLNRPDDEWPRHWTGCDIRRG